jgi:DNA-binding transcriptional MerR regulator
MKSKVKIKGLILKGFLGCIGTLILILWKLISWIQKETNMDFFHWVFIIIVVLSVGYGIYELVIFLYRLWKQCNTHKIDIDDIKKAAQSNVDKTEQNISNATEKINQEIAKKYHELEQSIGELRKVEQGNTDNAFNNHQYILKQISEIKRTLEHFENRIQPDGRILKYYVQSPEK